MIPEAKSSAPLIDDTDHPHVEVGHGYSDCVEILEMTSISHAPSAGSRGGAQPLGQAAPISRPRQLGVVGVVDEALLIQEMDGRTSPFDCRTPDTGLGAGQGAGQGSSAGPGASRSPNPRNTFQASRRTSKRNKSYSYKDFLPEWTVQPSVDQTFNDLILRANKWLESNKDVTVCNCETLCRMHTDRRAAYDAEMVTMSTSMSNNTQTYFVRGLRLWLSSRHKDIANRGEVLVVHEFIPRPGENSQQLVDRANSSFTDIVEFGRPITIESVATPLFQGEVSSQCTAWSDDSNKDLPHAFVVRVFTGKSALNENVIQIGIIDFIPEPISSQQLESPTQFEGFNELVDRANIWLREQPSYVVMTNMQSIMQQRTKDIMSGDDSVPHTSCFFVLPGMLSERNIEFLRVLRIAYATNYQTEPLAEGKQNSAYPISYETFSPALIKTGRHPTSAERLEKTKEMFSRVAEYTRHAMADVICIETVLNPLQANTEYNCDHEMRWILTTRLYISGPTYGYDEEFSRKLAEHSFRFERRKRKQDNGHRPIFLNNVVGRRFKYRMLLAAGTLVVCMTIITVISVFYSNM